jgi:hypothetical protein
MPAYWVSILHGKVPGTGIPPVESWVVWGEKKNVSGHTERHPKRKEVLTVSGRSRG